MADIFPGARVVEAGVGSGALTMSLLRAVGDQGTLHSFERREDFADIAQGNVRAFFGGPHPAWQVTVGDLVESLPTPSRPGSASTASSWTCWPPGSASTSWPTRSRPAACSSATSRRPPSCPGSPRRPATTAASPSREAWESLVRGWHLEGLAVRPQHRMHGHTGFLITTRRLAPGVTPPLRKRRPAKGASDEDGARRADPASAGERLHAEDVGERVLSDKKIRRVRRSVTEPPPQEYVRG